MQALSRRVLSKFLVQNLGRTQIYKSSYASALKQNLAAATQNPHTTVQRNYATKKKQNLLRYPALPLEETVMRFLKSAEPFLNAEELEHTKKEIQVFLKCEAPKLQKLLVAAAAKEENWLSDRWLRVAYLQYRDPVVVYSSPGMTFPTVKFECDDDYLIYTSKVIYCMIKFKELIDAGKMPVVKIGKNELDNGQFGLVLGTCRIPEAKEDKMEYNPKSTHVAVIYKNHFYKVPVYSKSHKPLHPYAILEQLNKIVDTEKSEGVPFGILTTDKRDNWAIAYKELLKIEGNAASVKEIQKSLFTVSLDGEVCYDPCDNINNVKGEHLIHGHGSKFYGANRWFDKTIQLLVSRSGFVGFSYEHSPAEGQPIALMADYIIKNLDDEKLLDNAACDGHDPPKKLALKTSKDLDNHIATAKKNLDKLVADIHFNIVHFKGYGKGFLKQQKLSPDSYVQMALQYTFYKLHKTPGAAYESAHLRIFRNGRTETIRSCSNESIAFARAMLEPNPDDLRVNLLRKAVSGHRDYTTLALLGKGCDRYLLGLKLMALENNLPIPKFYELDAVKRSGHFRLSTSQVASVNDAFMCYGPPLHDAYACCYNPREGDMLLAVSSWRSNDDTCSDRFAAALQESLEEMSGVLCRAGEKPKNKL